MKKILTLFMTIILIVVVVLGISFLGKEYYSSKDSDSMEKEIKEETKQVSELIQAGYTEKEEKLIIEKLSNEQIQLVINNQYDKDILLALLNEKYFVGNNLDRYFKFYEIAKEKNFTEIIKDVNSYIDYEFYTEQEPADTSKGLLMIANKHYALSEDFEGMDLVAMDAKYAYYKVTYYLNKEAYDNFERMWNDAKKEGLDFGVYSAYRSYKTQTNLYNNYVSRDGKKLADTYSARPGNSEHQLGLAVDLKTRTMHTDYFEKSKEYAWLQQNAYKYGFILRYELGQEYITGYQYEPWHYRYCGVDCATYIHENKITFEEYYEYFIKNNKKAYSNE